MTWPENTAQAQADDPAHARVLNHNIPLPPLIRWCRATPTPKPTNPGAPPLPGPGGVLNEVLLKGLRPKYRLGIAGARLPTVLASPGSHPRESEVQVCNSHVRRCEEASQFKLSFCRILMCGSREVPRDGATRPGRGFCYLLGERPDIGKPKITACCQPG